MKMNPNDTTRDIRPSPLPQHSILLIRAQACQDDDPAMIACCDIALGRAPDERDLERLDPGAAETMRCLTARDAITLISNHTKRAR
jgi:hypothetical protein